MEKFPKTMKWRWGHTKPTQRSSLKPWNADGAPPKPGSELPSLFCVKGRSCRKSGDVNDNFLCSPLCRWPEHKAMPGLSIFCSGLGLQLSQLRISCDSGDGFEIGFPSKSIPGVQAFTKSRNYHTHTLWHSDIPWFRSNRNICIQPGATGIAMGTLRKVTLGRNSVCAYWSLAPR